VHDVSDGGLLVAIAEMAMASGIGAQLSMPDDGIAALFGEDQARYVLTVGEKRAAAILSDAKRAGVPARIIGTTGGADLVLPNGDKLMIARLRNAHEAWFPLYMSGDPV